LRTARLVPVAVGSIALVVYALTLLPGMAFGDWGEMQTVPHVLGVAHPTGYPSYILLSWLWHLIPIGSVAFRSNLLSAVLVSCALASAAAVLLRLDVRPSIASASALAMGAVATVWAAATVAEVNPLHLLFVALILHRALAWEQRRSLRDLLIGALFVGLALGNHLLILFVAPFVAVFVLWVGRREIAERPWILVPAAGAVLLGLATYLYIPIAAMGSPPLPYNHPVTLDSVLWLVGGTQFRGQFGFLSPNGLSEFTGSLPALWSLLATRATPVVPILGLVGLAVLVRRRPAFGLMCAAILVVNLYLWANYLRLEHYLLVPWLLLAIGAGFALESVARTLAALVGSDAGGLDGARLVGATVGAVAVTFAVGLAVTDWPVSDRSRDRTAEVFVDRVLTALPPDAAILSEWDASTPLWHARWVLGRRPDVLIVDDTNVVYEGWGTREQRIAALICDRPVFMVRLDEADLLPTRIAYRVEPFLGVEVAAGGPSASIMTHVFRIEPLTPAQCGGAG
jgi:hypothetical protein